MSDLTIGWAVVRVGDVVALNPKNDAKDQTEAGFSPMQQLGTEFRSSVGFEPRPWGEIKKSYTHFANGDVLLAKITPCFENGKAGLVAGMPNGIGAGSSEYFVCRPRPGVLEAKYLLAHFKNDSFLRSGAVKMTGSVGHKRVPKDYLLNSQFPLAPIREQKRIADKLDAVLARVGACRDHLDRVPGILKRFRQAVLAAATSGELTKESSGSARLDWSFERAQDVCAKVQSGGTPKEGFRSSSGIPFLKVYNIIGQKVAFEYRPQFVAGEVHEGSLAKSRVLPGDVLMNIVGPPLGKIAVVPATFAQWNINQAIAMFRPSDRITSGWLYCVLCSGSNIADIVHETRGSAGQTNISLSQCRDFIFPVPPLDEQAEIVHRVESLFAWADRLEARHAAARAQVERLTPALLAKAFRGELVPQDPTDEPASELLKRLTERSLANPTVAMTRQGAKPRRARASKAASNVREESSS